jgi:hypothetical protein
MQSMRPFSRDGNPADLLAEQNAAISNQVTEALIKANELKAKEIHIKERELKNRRAFLSQQ